MSPSRARLLEKWITGYKIGAFRYEIPDSLAHIYLQIENIQENTHKDLTILTVGSYGTYEMAAAYRDEIRTDYIRDAFVVAYNQDPQAWPE